jgi:hypothetical protein
MHSVYNDQIFFNYSRPPNRLTDLEADSQMTFPWAMYQFVSLEPPSRITVRLLHPFNMDPSHVEPSEDRHFAAFDKDN